MLDNPLFLGLLSPTEIDHLELLANEIGDSAARLYHDRLPAVVQERRFQLRLKALQHSTFY